MAAAGDEPGRKLPRAPHGRNMRYKRNSVNSVEKSRAIIFATQPDREFCSELGVSFEERPITTVLTIDHFFSRLSSQARG
jgi:hypothetical protein